MGRNKALVFFAFGLLLLMIFLYIDLTSYMPDELAKLFYVIILIIAIILFLTGFM